MPGEWARVRNQTQETILADRAVIATSALQLLLGLIPYKSLDRGQGMLLLFSRATGWSCSIHTWFLHFPIDVVFLDKESRIRRVYRNLPAFRVAWAPPGTRTAIELPAGTFQTASCALGDLITIEPLDTESPQPQLRAAK